jgi:hypothetical protein
LAKSGFHTPSIKAILKATSKNSGWALCVGSGISVPAFPSWHDLVEKLIALDKTDPDAQQRTKNLLSSFSPDAIIQATQERLDLSDNDFASKLAEILYGNIARDLSPSQFDHFTKCLNSHSGDLDRAQWMQFLNIVRSHYPNLTALQIAIVVNEVLGTDLSPNAILSFNAEPLFPTLINAIHREGLYGKQAPSNKQARGKKIIDLVTHSISHRKANRLPFFFCHGLLPVPTKRKSKRNLSSVDKLVFSESEYLHLSNSSFAWQSSAFIDICASHTVIFLGVSLSDSDMRKWLSWIHRNRLDELTKLYSHKGASTTHYWIRTLPDDPNDQSWIEAAVGHLGVRLIWIDDWQQSGDALRYLLGIKKQSAA